MTCRRPRGLIVLVKQGSEIGGTQGPGYKVERPGKKNVTLEALISFGEAVVATGLPAISVWQTVL